MSYRYRITEPSKYGSAELQRSRCGLSWATIMIGSPDSLKRAKQSLEDMAAMEAIEDWARAGAELGKRRKTTRLPAEPDESNESFVAACMLSIMGTFCTGAVVLLATHGNYWAALAACLPATCLWLAAWRRATRFSGIKR